MSVGRLFGALITFCALYISLVSFMRFNNKILPLAARRAANVAISEREGPTHPTSGLLTSLIHNVFRQTGHGRDRVPGGQLQELKYKESGPQERSPKPRDDIDGLADIKGLEEQNETRWSKVRFEPISMDMFVFAVYHDQRPAPPSAVRIFMLQKRSANHTARLMCGFDGVTGRVDAEAYEMCENHEKKYGGWIYSCLVPETASPPLTDVVVFVVDNGGRVLNKLKFRVVAIETRMIKRHADMEIVNSTHNDIQKAEIINSAVIKSKTNHSGLVGHRSNSDRFNSRGTVPKTETPVDLKYANMTVGVCVPPLHGHLYIESLVTFIEFSRILGADRVFFYTHNLPEDFLEVLKTYMKEATPNILSLTDWPLPFQASTYQDIWNHGQILAIQHCLYTNMANFDWLLFIDIDEMLIPQKVDTWQDVIQLAVSQHKLQVIPQDVAAISLPSAYFQQNVQTLATSNIKYFSHLDRSMHTDTYRSKLMVDPKQIFELGIHHVSRAMSKAMKVIDCSPDLGLVHHYRACTEHAHPQCRLVQEDITILRYEARVTIASRQIMINGNRKRYWTG